jgi:Xaa-Pro aminopeptidase
LSALVRPGVPLAEVQAHLSAMRPGSASFVAIDGVGLGMEPPLLHSAGKAMFGPVDALQAGMTLTVQAYLCSRDLGSYYRNDMVLIMDEGYELLSRRRRDRAKAGAAELCRRADI